MSDMRNWRCPNEHCTDFGRPNQGQIRLAGWSGKGKRIRLLRCSTCGRAFSERTWTPFHGSRLTEEKDMEVIKLYTKGHSIRAIARMTGVSRPAVRRKIKNGWRVVRMEEAYREKREAEEFLARQMAQLGFVPMTDLSAPVDQGQHGGLAGR